MSTRDTMRDRLAELLAGEAVLGNDGQEQAELARLLAGRQEPDRDAMMRLAGLVQLAFLRQDGGAQRAMPAALRERLASRAAAWTAARPQARAADPD